MILYWKIRILLHMNKCLTKNILGFEVFSGTKRHVGLTLHKLINERLSGPYCVSCLNPHSYVVSTQDEQFRQSLHGSNILLPDGIGILIGGVILNKKISERITGMDFFLDAMHALNISSCHSKRVFFLGGQENVLLKIKEKVRNNYENITEIGYYSPPFKDEFDDADVSKMIKLISDFKPEILWVGMTAPKQEKLAGKLKGHVDPVLIGCIGAVFDFYAGNVNRSAPVFAKLGLEWLPRLIRQPRRLWRRTFISAPIFLLHICVQKLWKTHK